VLGYDGSATLDEVRKGRGLSNTILMIQVRHDDTTGVSPWIAGGGATLRGVPESNSIAPFVLSTDRNGKPISHQNKRGTYVLMTDGSVRFIDQNVSDEVFKAMCTVNGPAPKTFDPAKDPNTPLIPGPNTKIKKPVTKEPPVKAEPPVKKDPGKDPPIDKKQNPAPEKKEKSIVRHLGDGRIHDKEAGFSIVFPQGWQRNLNPQGARMGAFGAGKPPLAPDLKVIVAKHEGGSAKKLAQDTKLVSQIFKEWKALSETALTIDGKDAYALETQISLQGVTVKTLTYWIIGSKGSYCQLVFAAEGSVFDRNRKSFEQTALGVQID
jgi:hypothetical protein